MKKKKVIRFASLLLVFVMATTSLLGGTLAKYTSSASGADTATVAKWDIEVDGTDITEPTTFAFDLFNTIKDSDGSTEADVVSSSIAPGTSGSFALNVANKSEVNANGTITLKVEAPEGMTLKFSNCRFVDLPSGYTQLEYIESAGKSWFTGPGYEPNTNTRVVADAQFLDTSGSASMFGTMAFCLLREGSKLKVGYWGAGDSNYSYFSASVDDILKRMTFSLDNKLYVDGTLLIDTEKTGMKTGKGVMWFFTRHATAGYTYPGKLRLFSMQIYEGDTLLYDFVPAKNSSGTAGLYDLVKKTFHKSNGDSGNGSAVAFTAGPEPVINTVKDGASFPVRSGDPRDNNRNSFNINMGVEEFTNVYWKWDYEDGTTATDSNDTAVGIAADAAAIITATAKFEQVD